MLKMTAIANPESPFVLKLEGKLLAPWIDELQQTIANLPVPASELHLDLSGLSFADASGIAALTTLLEQGAVVVSATGFVATLLRRTTR